MDLPTAQSILQELANEGIRADMRSVGEWSVEGGVPADYGVEVYAPGLTLAQLELVVKVAKEHSSDFGIGIDARIIMA